MLPPGKSIPTLAGEVVGSIVALAIVCVVSAALIVGAVATVAVAFGIAVRVFRWVAGL